MVRREFGAVSGRQWCQSDIQRDLKIKELKREDWLGNLDSNQD